VGTKQCILLHGGNKCGTGCLVRGSMLFFFLLHFFTFYFDGLKAFWSPQGSPRMFCLTTGGYILLHCTFSVSFLADFYTDSGSLHHLTLFISGLLLYLSLYQHVHFGSLLGQGAFRPLIFAGGVLFIMEKG